MRLPAFAQKLLGRSDKAPTLRSFSGAEAGRRWSGFADMPSAIASMLASGGTLARRGRGLVANNGHAASGAEAWTSALVGTGLKVQAQRNGVAQSFEAWTDEADADGLTDFYGLQGSMARSMVVSGEAFALILPNGQIRQIDPEQVDRNLTQATAAGGRIVQGVEFDAAGRKIAFHIRRDQPGMPLAVSYEIVRVPADRCIHMFKPIFPGQVRGLSWFAPVLLRMADYDQAVDAQIQRQIVAAMLTGFVIAPDGNAGGFFGEEKSPVLQASLEPGTMQVIPPGHDIRFSDPAKIGAEAIDFLKVTRDEVAAGLGVPSHVLSGDLSQANYSSLRAGLVEWRRRVEAIQHSVVVFQFCRPIWRNWLLQRALAGSPDMAGYFNNPVAFEAAKWITPRFDWVDPLKDAEAEISAIGAGLMSRRQAVAARGFDIEQLDAEIAADNVRARGLGLEFTTNRPRIVERDSA